MDLEWTSMLTFRFDSWQGKKETLQSLILVSFYALFNLPLKQL